MLINNENNRYDGIGDLAWM